MSFPLVQHCHQPPNPISSDRTPPQQVWTKASEISTQSSQLRSLDKSWKCKMYLVSNPV